MSPELETTAAAPPTEPAQEPAISTTTADAETTAAATSSTVAAPATNAPASTTATPIAHGIVDREKLCPFLLKMFYKQGEHHRVDQYKPTSLPPKSSELQLYTWKNATMGEIASLVQQAIPDLIDTVSTPETGGELHFRHIYLDMTRGIYVGRDIGTVLLVDTLVEDDGVDATTVGVAGAEADGDVKMDGEGEGEKADKTGDVGAKKEEEGQGLTEVDPAQGLLTKDIRKNRDSVSAAAAAASALATAITAAATQATFTTAGTAAGKKSTALEKTLGSIRFVIGDYLDISIVSRTGGRAGAAVAGGTGGGREQALFTGRQGRNQRGGGGGPMRRAKDERRRDGRRREGGGGGGGGGGGRMADRFAGRLGLMEPSERNGHGSHAGGRRGVADSEASWKGRGRGR
ncbi:mtDNA inheritance, partitioning of the mitochondrial organelle [Linnemannia gamsii]|uniref:MtDNA inheritance, partitioning of the mitochondrial organelle n=1 Tax=Linnemannia gamsii TaxID=64522 RepID=A0ABQ7KB77_9FUNG|nr:mtDNA inheritance, partitioning of the mitochondrial organelle [Linnemannia gamsii]